MDKIKVLIIEDNRLLRETIHKILSLQEDIQIVGAISSDDDKTKIIDYQPDVVLINISLNVQKCINFIEFIHSELSRLKIILMDLSTKQEEVLDYIQLGVSGFILSNAAAEEILSTLKSVAACKKILPSNLIEILFEKIVQNSGKSEMNQLKDLQELTSRERTIIEKLNKGYSNKEIAYELNISVETVKSHVHHILEKLSLKKRTQIAPYLQQYVFLKSNRPY